MIAGPTAGPPGAPYPGRPRSVPPALSQPPYPGRRRAAAGMDVRMGVLEHAYRFSHRRWRPDFGAPGVWAGVWGAVGVIGVAGSGCRGGREGLRGGRGRGGVAGGRGGASGWLVVGVGGAEALAPGRVAQRPAQLLLGLLVGRPAG